MASSDKVLWRATSSRHDWQKGGPAPAVLSAAVRLGLIGSPASIGIDFLTDGGQVSFATGEDLALEILNRPRTAGRMVARVAGESPSAWELFLEIMPFDHEGDWTEGTNVMWLTFDRSRVPDRTASDALVESFVSAHTADDTGYAVIHPYDHWSRFAAAHYTPPRAIGPKLRGMFWANFLGPGHLDEFDHLRLHWLAAPIVRWIDDAGVFVIAAPDLASADAPSSEAAMLRLTGEFRSALLPDSR